MGKKNNFFRTTRCQNLLCIGDMPVVAPLTHSFYHDLQKDYAKFVPIFLRIAGIPHGVLDDQGNVTYVHKEQLEQSLIAQYGPLVADLKHIGAALRTGGKAASSFYGIFCQEYEPRNKAKTAKGKIQFLDNLANLSDAEISSRIETDPNLNNLPLERWMEIREQKKNGIASKELWDALAPELVNPANTAYVKIRESGIIKSARPADKGYCSSLANMIRKVVSSAHELYLVHLAETQKIQEQFAAEKAKAGELFEIVEKIAADLDAAACGLTRKIVEIALNIIEKGGNCENNYAKVAVEIMKKVEYEKFRSASWQERNSAYAAYRLKDQLARRRVYPLAPNLTKHSLVQLDLTSTTKFHLKCEDGKLSVKLDGAEEIHCFRSDYFSDLKITPRHAPSDDGKTVNHWYDISFRHRVKTRKPGVEKVGDEIFGTLKSIGLQEDEKGQLFISLPHEIVHPINNTNLAIFLRSAEASEERKNSLPENFRAAAFDLNIVNPLVGCVVEATRNGTSGEFEVLDYGRAKLIQPPTILSGRTSLCEKILEITVNMRKVVQAIRSYKTMIRTGNPIDEKTLAFLSTANSPSPAIRCLIQCRIAKLNNEHKNLHDQVRKTGYRELSEGLRVLAMIDARRSMIDCYDRIHLKPGEILPKVKKFDERRHHLRLLIARRLAAAAVAFAKIHKCNVIFLEDLNMRVDQDRDDNSLTRLFSASMLLDAIKSAGEKFDLPIVHVAPEGTSRTDIINGNIGVRRGDNLYVERNGKLFILHADEAACLNIMNMGLKHSVPQYKFKAVKKKENDEEEKEIGKRKKRYFSMLGLPARPWFSVKDGNITASKKKPKESLEGVWLYAHTGRFVLASDRDEEIRILEQKIKDVPDNVVIPKISTVHDVPETGYGNFAFPKMLDTVESLSQKEVRLPKRPQLPDKVRKKNTSMILPQENPIRD